jgi:DNA-binding beta-propeller fold protein YncE
MKQMIVALMAVAALAGLARAQSAGEGTSRWQVLDSWGQLPADLTWGAASQISTTPDGNLLVLRRSNPAFLLLRPDGSFVRAWGDDLFRLAHGVRVDRDGFIWVTDNTDNIVQKFSPDGPLLLTLGRRGVAGDNTARDAFDGPADVFIAPDGDILVADGYRNSRIVRFSGEGEFRSIIGGTRGAAPGEFDVPHAVVVDSRGRVIVADAENSRLQLFDRTGAFLEQWTDFPAKPRGSMYITADDTLYVSHVDAEAVTIMRDGRLIDTIRGVGGRPHGVTLDRDGHVYVANTANQMVKKIRRN